MRRENFALQLARVERDVHAIAGADAVGGADDSRPILERLGFIPVTTTTPYVWSPPTNEASES